MFNCINCIKIQNYERVFFPWNGTVIFSVRKTKHFFIYWAPDHYILLKRGKGMQIGILNTMRAHQYTQTIPLTLKKIYKLQNYVSLHCTYYDPSFVKSGFFLESVLVQYKWCTYWLYTFVTWKSIRITFPCRLHNICIHT